MHTHTHLKLFLTSLFNKKKLLKTLRRTINMLLRLIKSVPEHLVSLYTLPNRLRPLINQLEQVIKFINLLRKILIKYNTSCCRISFLRIRVVIFIKPIIH